MCERTQQLNELLSRPAHPRGEDARQLLCGPSPSGVCFHRLAQLPGFRIGTTSPVFSETKLDGSKPDKDSEPLGSLVKKVRFRNMQCFSGCLHFMSVSSYAGAGGYLPAYRGEARDSEVNLMPTPRRQDRIRRISGKPWDESCVCFRSMNTILCFVIVRL